MDINILNLLQGPWTLVIKDSDKVSRKIFLEIDNKHTNEVVTDIKPPIETIIKIDDKYRKILANKLKPMIDQPTNDQGLIFLTNRYDSKFAAIHSEPDETKKRLCGTKSYINHDYNKYKLLK